MPAALSVATQPTILIRAERLRFSTSWVLETFADTSGIFPRLGDQRLGDARWTYEFEKLGIACASDPRLLVRAGGDHEI
jgi:hypothetical protein